MLNWLKNNYKKKHYKECFSFQRKNVIHVSFKNQLLNVRKSFDNYRNSVYIFYVIFEISLKDKHKSWKKLWQFFREDRIFVNKTMIFLWL